MMQLHDSGPATLAELEARLRRDLELLVMPPSKDWLELRVHPDHGPVLDVAVIGAGMSGLSAAFALKCLAIRGLRVFDRSPASKGRGRRSPACRHCARHRN
jgi:threonine dehydrogenase-like Zn-dependent dehydrogenase